MLSAIAARKAAQNAKKTAVEPSTLPPRREARDGAAVATSKISGAQISEETQTSPRKRKRKPVSTRNSTPSISISAHHKELSTSSKQASAESPGEAIRDDTIPATPGPSKVAKKNRRAFSPSRPATYSDGVDVEQSGVESSDIADLEEYPSTSRPSGLVAFPAANFLVEWDTNVFRISEDDVRQSRLPESSVGSILLSLRPSQSLPFTGTVNLTVLSGCVSLFGVPISSDNRTHAVFAPTSHPIPSITALPTQSTNCETVLPPRIASWYQSGHSVFILHSLHSGIQGLGEIIPVFESSFDPVTTNDWNLTGFHPIFDTSSKRLHPFHVPPDWQATLGRLITRPPEVLESHPMIALVRGSKNSGKSTFAKLLLNNLLTKYRKVAFIECDIGQSEFTSPGIVSLHILQQPVFGPSFTHPIPPELAHYIGSSTPRSKPSYYLSCIASLIQAYRLDVQYSTMESISEAQEGSNQISSAVPLVINTQGWVKGLGADLLLKIEALVEPTHVITLGVDSQPINIDETISRYFLDGISPAIPPPSHTAADLRALSIISYFYSATSPSNPESTLWDTSLPLCSQPPWEVDWTIALKKVILLGPGAEDVFPEEVENSLNCGLVALIESDDDFGDDLIPTATAVPYKQGQRVPPPTSSRCLGLGLIRAINREAHVFHLLTPIRSSLLGRCNALVKGELEIPTWCMMDFRQDDDSVCGLKGAAVPYLHWGAQVGVGADKRRVRRNLMRRGQM